MQAEKNISTIHESMIVSALSQCLDLIILISKDPTRKETHIFIEHLFLSLRELSFYIDKYFGKNLDKRTLAYMDGVKDIRDAICHRSSPLNLLNPNLLISGGFNFKNNDIEVQYGKTKILLREGVVGLYLQFRKTISDSKHFTYIKKHPSWNIEERRLEETNKKLAKALSTGDIVNKMKEAWK